MTTPEDQVAAVLPCEVMASRSVGATIDYYCGRDGWVCRSCRLRPAILALIHTLLREERERCAEHAASLFDANGYTAVAEAIRALGDRP